jgi:hypothetical protein
MNCLIEIEKERETKLKSAKIEDGFYNIIGGQRSGAGRKLSVINPATGKELATVPDIVAPDGLGLLPQPCERHLSRRAPHLLGDGHDLLRNDL